jgi:hypothetical protein
MAKVAKAREFFLTLFVPAARPPRRSRLARSLKRIGHRRWAEQDFGRKTMFGQELKKMVVGALGALVLTTVSVGAAVGPARAIETGGYAAVATPVAAPAHV